MNLRTISLLVAVALSSTMFARKGSVTVKLSDYMTDRQTHTQSINRCLRDVAAYQKRQRRYGKTGDQIEEDNAKQ